MSVLQDRLDQSDLQQAMVLLYTFQYKTAAKSISQQTLLLICMHACSAVATTVVDGSKIPPADTMPFLRNKLPILKILEVPQVDPDTTLN